MLRSIGRSFSIAAAIIPPASTTAIGNGSSSAEPGTTAPRIRWANPLPLAVWTIWRVGLTMAHALLGNLWSALNPWRGVYVLLGRVPGTALDRAAAPALSGPARLLAGIGLFLGFIWFELVFTVPQNPEILSNMVAAYSLLTLLGMLLFGGAGWLRHAEAFSVFFRVVSWLSPLNGRPDKDAADGAREVFLTLPGLGLPRVRPLAVSGVAFVLLICSARSPAMA